MCTKSTGGWRRPFRRTGGPTQSERQALFCKPHIRGANHERVCRSDTCNWWGYYGFLTRYRQEHWSAVTAKSVVTKTHTTEPTPVWHVHLDCVGKATGIRRGRRREWCIPNADGDMRRVGRTLIYERWGIGQEMADPELAACA